MTTVEFTATTTTREDRGYSLFHDHAANIWRVAPHLYRVPSCSGNSIYLVSTTQGAEHCPCGDFEHRGGLCKHLHAAHIFRAKSGECADCRGRFLRRDLFEVGEDHLTWFEGDELCRECAGKSGIR